MRQKWESKENEWRAFQQKRMAFRNQYDQGMQTLSRVNEMLSQMTSMERSWKDTGLDTAVLENLYAALEKRVTDARAMIKKAMDEQSAGAKQWEAAAAMPEAEAPKAEAPAPKAEAPAPKAEAPAPKTDAPGAKRK